MTSNPFGLSRRQFLASAAITLAPVRFAFADTATPVKGGTLVYLEQQAHTVLYPPAGGFYPNGGVLNQVTDKLTYQNPKTLELEPWIAESWEANDQFTEFTFKIRPGITFSDGTPLDAAAVAKNYDVFALGDKTRNFRPSEVLNNYDHSEVIDPLTVKFVFKKPSAGFLQGTSVPSYGVGKKVESLGLDLTNALARYSVNLANFL